jgi:Transposase IS4
MLRIVRYAGLEGSGRIIILDSGFQVLQALIELQKVGLYGSAIIKWKGNWPKGVDGDLMESEAMKLVTGESAAMKGTKNGVPFYLWVLRDSMYVLKFMSTYGSTNTHILAKPVRRRACIQGAPPVVFKHDVVCFNYYNHRNAVDINNNGRQKCDPLEETILSQNYAQRVLCHVLNTCEQNSLRAFNNFARKPMGLAPLSVREFRMQHIEAVFMLHSKSLSIPLLPLVPSLKRGFNKDAHLLATIPHYSHYQEGSLGIGGWKQDLKMRYVQRRCHVCDNKTSLYCKCNLVFSVCQDCFLKHIDMHLTD